MIKKNLWIVALLAVTAFLFMGCPDNNGDFKADFKVPLPPEATDDLVIEDAEEIAALLKAVGYYGAATTGMSVDGNTAIFDIPSGGSSDNFGFELKFPEDAEGFLALEVSFKFAAATSLPGGRAKIGFKSQISPGTVDVEPYDDHEIVFGTTGDVGVTKVQKFSLSSPNKLPGNVVYFNHNKYGSGDKQGADPAAGNVAYKLEITKIVFKAGEPVPCCTDCDTATCKDCSADACTSACGTACCLNFNGNTTTSVALVAGNVVHTNPPVVASGGGAAINNDGVVTMNNYSLLFYKFPADTAQFKIADYDYLEITYTLSNVVNVAPADGTNLKIEWRDYGGVAAYSTGRWDDLGSVGADKTKTIQTWGDNGTGGFVIRMNSYDVKPSGDGTCAEKIDIKITKIEFKKGTRYTVEFFSPMTPANNNFAKIQVLNGNGIGASRMPTVSNNGWAFTGWVDAWDKDLNTPATGANTVTASTPITADTKLFASWLFLPLPTVTLNAATDDTLFAAAIGNAGNTVAQGWIGSGATTKFTHSDGKKYWIVSDARGYTDTTITTALDATKYDWTAKVTGEGAVSQTDFDAAKNHHKNNYTRLGLDLTTIPYWEFYSTVTITYDAIPLGGTDAKGTLVKKSSNAAGGDANAKTTAGNEYPELTGKDQTIVYNVSEFTSGGASGTVKGIGFQKNNNGAYLLRITKVELKL